jgi:hypothetical protein
MTGFYRSLIKEYAELAKPLEEAIKPGGSKKKSAESWIRTPKLEHKLVA